jgi:hypothetical protein
MFMVGAVSLIPIYLVWLVWRCQERVLGEDYGAIQARSSHADDGRIAARKPGEGAAVVGIACGLFGLFFEPSVSGTLGIALGVLGFIKGVRRLGVVAVVLGAAALVLSQFL